MINLFIIIYASFTNPFEYIHVDTWNEDDKAILFQRKMKCVEWLKGHDANDPNMVIKYIKLPIYFNTGSSLVPYHGGAKFYSLKDGSRIDNRYFAADEFKFEWIYIFPKEWVKEVDKRTGRAEIAIPKGRYSKFIETHANRFCVVLED